MLRNISRRVGNLWVDNSDRCSLWSVYVLARSRWHRRTCPSRPWSKWTKNWWGYRSAVREFYLSKKAEL